MTKTIKVAPAPTKETNFERPCMCFCKMFSPVFVTMRIFALFPLTWKHEGKCTYRWSWSWGTYTVICIIAQGYLAITCAKYSTMFSSDKQILSFLDDITSIIYSHYVLVTLVFNLMRIPGSLKTLETFAQLPEELICGSARRTSYKIQRYSVLFNYFVVLVHAVLLILVYWTDEYHQDGFHSVLNRLTQSYPFATYLIQSSFIGCVDYGLVCQERLARSAYGYSKLHPNLNDESNNHRRFLFVYSHKICSGDHDASKIFRKKSTAEVVEILRGRHEECCKVLYLVNKTGNPYFLVHMLVEFLVLVIHWFAVILHITHNLSGPANVTIHTRNCIFVVFHTTGLIYFLNIAHKIKHLVSIFLLNHP
nr:unnamed protein product [Callosobruchus chinensis]